MKYTDQNNLPFIHKDTKKIIKNGKILLVIKKNKYFTRKQLQIFFEKNTRLKLFHETS